MGIDEYIKRLKNRVIVAINKVISTDPETMETSPKTVLETYIKEVTTLYSSQCER